MTQEKPIVDSITDASGQITGVLQQFWQLVTSSNQQPIDPSKTVKVSDLPLYAEDNAPVQYKFIPETPLPLQKEFATVRIAFQQEYDRVAERFKVVDCAVKQSKNAVKKVDEYLTEEWTALPKAAAITVGGMAGFVLGLKRGFIGRTFTTAVGLGTMAAFCYPVESVDVVKTGVAHTETAWATFQQSPEPVSQKNVNLSPPK